jgi:Tfp pilus assembly major pilin PilA
MKDQTSIIIAVAATAYLAVRIYQKYIKKDQGKKNTATKSGSFPSSSKEDEYEPYSKK